MQTPANHPLKFLHLVLDELIFYIIKIQHLILIDSPRITFWSLFLQLQESPTTIAYV